MTQVNKEIVEALGQPAEALDFLAKLPPDAQVQLAEDVQAARQQHKREIIASLEQAVEHIPRLLRGPIRKLFGV